MGERARSSSVEGSHESLSLVKCRIVKSRIVKSRSPVARTASGYRSRMASLSHSESNGRVAALELAERIRTTRETLIEQVRVGAVELRQILDSQDPYIRVVKVVTVIENLPGLGKVKARRILDEVGISANLKIDRLDEDRRARLLGHFEALFDLDSETRSLQ